MVVVHGNWFLGVIGDVLPLTCMHPVNSSRQRELEARTQFGLPGCYGNCAAGRE